MKKTIYSSIVILAAALAMMAFAYRTGKTFNPPQDKPASVFPENVQKILENICFNCHDDASSNAKAKAKVNFSTWGEMSDAKKVAKMQNISDEITKDDMPPAKYTNDHPDKALTKEQKDILNKWITGETAKLMGQ
jgi:hypothetical protein